MLTEEQIKSLKEGDKLLAEVQFHSFADYDALVCLAPLTIGEGEVIKADSCFNASCLSLPPKYDPTRRLKKGDKVRLKVVNGRVPCDSAGFDLPWDGVIYTVEMDEVESAYANCVLLSCAELRLFVKIHVSHIELVTPVEERESFGVRYSTDRDCAEVYHRRYKNTVAAFYCKCGITREQAEEHAEAERDRLNAERRKDNN